MQLPPTTTAAETAVLLVLEVVVFLLGGLLLISGIVLAGSTATMVGRVPGYGLGLTFVNVGTTTIVGAAALHFHRRRIGDREEEIADHKKEIAVIRAEIDEIREEIRKIAGRIETIVRIEEKHSDQLAAQRNGRH